MLVRRKSTLTGMYHTMDLDVTKQQMEDYQNKVGLLQNIFPNLSPPEREFIKSGITPDEWDTMVSIFG